jgi:hypothetical protein
MPSLKLTARALIALLGLVFFVSGCVVEPREGYYDANHHRWWHEHAWHDCGDNDSHCQR